MTQKTILGLHPSHRDDIADLVTRRPLPGPHVTQVDPFLFLNHHGPQVYPTNNLGLPFGPHPHRGFETVTFILDGELMHRDSGGHESVIRAGGVQWMTAGAGIVHAELSSAEFKASGGPIELLQLWVNLPSRLKMTKPNYQGVQASDIPVVESDAGKVRVQIIAGAWGGVTGAIESITGNFMSTVSLEAGGKVDFSGLAGRNVFLYVVSGDVLINGREVAQHFLVELDTSGDSVAIEGTSKARLLFGHGDPIAEPVASYGPFVMNTADEIRRAIADYQAGRMGEVAG